MVRTVAIAGAEDMWDLLIANDHDFYVVTVDTASAGDTHSALPQWKGSRRQPRSHRIGGVLDAEGQLRYGTAGMKPGTSIKQGSAGP